MACVEKIVRTFGAGMSLRSQRRLAKFESLDTFIDTEATRNQTVDHAARERDATASVVGVAQAARETTETKRVKVALGNNCGADIARHANKLLKDFQSEFDAVEEEFANHAARRGFWTRLTSQRRTPTPPTTARSVAYVRRRRPSWRRTATLLRRRLGARSGGGQGGTTPR